MISAAVALVVCAGLLNMTRGSKVSRRWAKLKEEERARLEQENETAP
jgi:hypothetical protein